MLDPKQAGSKTEKYPGTPKTFQERNTKNL